MRLLNYCKFFIVSIVGILMKQKCMTISLHSFLFYILIQIPLFSVHSADESMPNHSMHSNRNSVTPDSNLTADDQINASEGQDELTRQIRRKITENNIFSSRARNITIVTLGDSITLRGKVDSKQEKDRVMAIVQNLAGKKSITNDLTYKSKL